MTINLLCKKCDSDFQVDPRTFAAMKFEGLPKLCPQCKDQLENRPATARVVKGGRRLIAEFPAVKVCLPHGKFALFTAHGSRDKPCLRATIRGRSLSGFGSGGVSWDGRIDIYALGNPPIVPLIARVRVMEVEHEDGHRRIERHGAPLEKKTEVEVAYPATYQYLVLEPVEAEPTAALILVSVDYKTTLKGFGRQWYARLDEGGALWAKRLSREARSGRFGVNGAVAIVDNEHPVIAEQWGDKQSVRRFTLTAPDGESV